MSQYTIMAHRVVELEKRIKRLNKKGGNIELETGSERVEEWTDPETNTKHRRLVVDIELQGLAPVIAGWTFIAALEWLDTDNVVTTAPDVQCPKEYWHREPVCEHCGLNRKRIYTFILQSESGEYKQVGKTCLQDFLRSSDPGWAVNVFALMGDLAIWAKLDPEECYGGGSPQGHNTLHLLGTTVGIIREYGWKARSKVVGNEIATADMVLEYLAHNPFFEPTPKDLETARQALVWVAALEPKSDYEHNLKAVLGDGEEGFVRFKHAGIACSAIPVFRRAEANSKAVSDGKVSEHFGEVGKRYRKLSARVTHVRYTEGMYGTTTVVSLVTPEGNELVWFASSGIKGVNTDELVGCSVLLDGTVKGHGEFRGVKQTKLNRCKIVIDG
jgi:hypothetical protein